MWHCAKHWEYNNEQNWHSLWSYEAWSGRQTINKQQQTNKQTNNKMTSESATDYEEHKANKYKTLTGEPL